MSKNVNITNAELEIMKVLWRKGSATSPQIFAEIKEKKSKSTLKTLLLRLVQKGVVQYEEINSRNYLYKPVISKKEYTSYNLKSFINKVFDGSAQKMLLNFIKEENITKSDLLKLIELIEEDE